jgi:taurine dioxygenase
VNVEHALRSLPADLREALEAHDADMMSVASGALAVRRCDERDYFDPAYRNRSPSILLNPKTGRRYVVVSEMHTAGLIGMSWENGRAVLGRTFDHLYAAATVHEHFWRNGDLLIWDNRACQHARGDMRDVGRRVLQRVILGPGTHPAPQGKRDGAAPRALSA